MAGQLYGLPAVQRAYRTQRHALVCVNRHTRGQHVLRHTVRHRGPAQIPEPARALQERLLCRRRTKEFLGLPHQGQRRAEPHARRPRRQHTHSAHQRLRHMVREAAPGRQYRPGRHTRLLQRLVADFDARLRGRNQRGRGARLEGQALRRARRNQGHQQRHHRQWLGERLYRRSSSSRSRDRDRQ